MITQAKKINPEKVKQCFSRASARYDSLTSLHQQIALELLDRLDQSVSHSSVLDIGMGTGWLTNKLLEKFPFAKVVGIDFSRKMLREAHLRNPQFSVVQADARALPFHKDSFDWIISNLAFQWIEDHYSVFQRHQQTPGPFNNQDLILILETAKTLENFVNINFAFLSGKSRVGRKGAFGKTGIDFFEGIFKGKGPFQKRRVIAPALNRLHHPDIKSLVS